MAQYAVSICEICIRGPGKHHCQQCDQLYCGNCKLSHLRSKISKKHTFLSGSNINKEKQLLCRKHEESFLFYCQDCDTPVFKICSVKEHSRHFMSELTETTETLKSDLVKNIESKVTTSYQNISKIEIETNTYREEVKAVMKIITDEGNYWKQLIDKKVEALIKEVQDEEQKEIQNMSACSKVYEGVVKNCQKWQSTIKKMETTADGIMLQKLKQLKTDVDQIVLKKIPDVPSMSYKNKKPLDTEIDNFFGEVQFRASRAIIEQTDNQQSSRTEQISSV